MFKFDKPLRHEMDPRKPHPCNTCGKFFSHASDLKRHIQIHTGEKPYSCDTCEKKFVQVSDLNRHQAIHSEEKPYACSICGKTFGHKNYVKKHERIHNGEMPYSCEKCGMSFTFSSQLSVHNKQGHIIPSFAEGLTLMDKPKLQSIRECRIDLKRIQLPPGPSDNYIASTSDAGLNRLNPKPKTLKARKNNEQILRDFSKDHADDMFENVKPNCVSKLNLLDRSFSSSSDEEEASGIHKTPITNYIPNFGGWSQESPNVTHHRSEVEDAETPKGKLSELAFVHKTLDERRKKPNLAKKRLLQESKEGVNGDKNYNAECSNPKLRKPHGLQNFLSELEPALVNLNTSQQDISGDEIEQYFDDDL